jgi:hypothetical protein
MKKIGWIILLVVLGASVSQAQGRSDLIDLLRLSKFKCTAESSIDPVTTCIGLISGYSQKVRIYIPKSYEAQNLTTLNIHFHGWRLDGVDTFKVNKSDLQGWGDYAARLAESGSSELLIIPESIGHCSTYKTELTGIGKFEQFVTEIKKNIGAKEDLLIGLSGHSGAGRVIDLILGSLRTNQSSLINQIYKIGFFDAVYDDLPNFRALVSSTREVSYSVSYLANGSTQSYTTNLKKLLANNVAKVKFSGVPASKLGPLYDHMMNMNLGGFSNFLSLSK